MISTVNFTIEFCYCPNTIFVLVVVSSIDNSRQIEPASTVLIAVDLVPLPRLIPVPSLPCPSAGTQTSAYFSGVSKKRKRKKHKKSLSPTVGEGGRGESYIYRRSRLLHLHRHSVRAVFR